MLALREAPDPQVDDLTPLQSAVLAQLRASPDGLSAYAIADSFAEERRAKRNANSVYRALDRLLDLGLVLHVATWKRFIAAPPEPSVLLL